MKIGHALFVSHLDRDRPWPNIPGRPCAARLPCSLPAVGGGTGLPS
jgi:hypothetical protein